MIVSPAFPYWVTLYVTYQMLDSPIIQLYNNSNDAEKSISLFNTGQVWRFQKIPVFIAVLYFWFGCRWMLSRYFWNSIDGYSLCSWNFCHAVFYPFPFIALTWKISQAFISGDHSILLYPMWLLSLNFRQKN